MDSLVSIVVPCYNQAIYLNEALESVLAQSYTNWECIIVNDGSPDNTVDVASEWCSKDSRFSYVGKENGGLSSARNAGIKIASGKYLLPLDADDKIEYNYLEKAVGFLDADADVAVVYGKAEYFGAKNGDVQLGEYSYNTLLEKNVIYCSAVCRLDGVKKLGGYDEALIYGLEDWELWIRLLQHGAKVVKIPETVFWYRAKTVSMIEFLNENEDKRRLMYDHICRKHIDLYLKYLGNPVLKYRELQSVKEELAFFKRTKTYRLIKWLNIFKR